MKLARDIKAVCITLQETPEKTERAKKHFAESGVGVVEFFNGIHAANLGICTALTYERDALGSGFVMNAKAVGIWLSHYTLWAAMAMLPNDHFLVLEDDARFSPDFKTRFDNAIRDVPSDFDVLFVGSCCCEGKEASHVAGEVFEVKHPMCFHAYVVAKKALPILLRTQRRLYAPIDISVIFHSFPQLKVYTVLPAIVNQWDTDYPT